MLDLQRRTIIGTRGERITYDLMGERNIKSFIKKALTISVEDMLKDEKMYHIVRQAENILYDCKQLPDFSEKDKKAFGDTIKKLLVDYYKAKY